MVTMPARSPRWPSVAWEMTRHALVRLGSAGRRDAGRRPLAAFDRLGAGFLRFEGGAAGLRRVAATVATTLPAAPPATWTTRAVVRRRSGRMAYRERAP